MPDAASSKEALNSDESVPIVERKILRAVKSLRCGSVEITAHDSQVVQIEHKERFRFDKHY